MTDHETAFATLGSTIPAIQEIPKPEFHLAERGTSTEATVAIIPDGMSLKSLKPLLDEYLVKPVRRTGTAQIDTIKSFVDITNRFKDENSAIFAKSKVNEKDISASLTAIFNYHPATPDNTEAEFIDHRAHYAFPLAKDFQYWLSRNRDAMNQLEFAIFIEERVIDMVAPVPGDKTIIDNLTPSFADPTTMLALSRDLEIYAKEACKTRIKLSNGETELKFSAEHVDANGAPIKIPDFFILNLPVFDGAAPQRIIVRLRYRLKEGVVSWFYDLYRIDRVFENAFNDACDQVEAETSLPLFIGSPETARA